MNELLIFAKYPESGKVKTRLARTIGAVEAAHRYRGMFETVVQKTVPLNGEYYRTLCFDPPEREDDFRRWFPVLELRPQSNGDLGHRMLTAFRESLASGVHSMGVVRGRAGSPSDFSERRGLPARANRSVLIGTDCVEIDRSLLCDAFERLEKADLVLGPAKDGGYYLIGMKKVSPSLFEGISWSTDRVLPETLEKAKENNFRVELLRTLADLDEEF